MDPHVREILRHGSAAFVVKILSALSVFAMTLILARTLGATQAGLFFLAATIVYILASLTRLGMDNVLVRFIASRRVSEEWGEIKGMMRTAFLWVLLASLAAALPFVVANDSLATYVFGKPELAPVMGAIAIAIPLTALFSLLASALQGLKRSYQALLVLNVALPGAMVLLIVTAGPSNAVQAAQLYVMGTGFAFLLGFLWWRTHAQHNRRVKPIDKRVLLTSSLPLLAVVFFEQVVIWSSQLLVGVWGSSSEVAVFNAALRTANLTSFVLIAVSTIAGPKFAEMNRLGQAVELQRTAIFATRLIAIIALVPFLAMLFWSSPIMRIFGAEFGAGGTALQILAAGQFVNVATGPVTFLLVMTGHERILRTNVLVAAIIAVTLGLLLIPSFGIVGAAISTAVAIAAQNLMGLWQIKRLLGFYTLSLR